MSASTFEFLSPQCTLAGIIFKCCPLEKLRFGLSNMNGNAQKTSLPFSKRSIRAQMCFVGVMQDESTPGGQRVG
eukprot:m.81040 g.81040  ORF g.81040 m.81040 type:complete len:74 (+) comp10967_c0_seq2:146-367(+)